jgi:hypothetical protein
LEFELLPKRKVVPSEFIYQHVKFGNLWTSENTSLTFCKFESFEYLEIYLDNETGPASMNSATQYSWKLAQAAAVRLEAHAENGQRPTPRARLAKNPTVPPPTVLTALPHVCAAHCFTAHPYPCCDQGKKQNTLSSSVKPMPPLFYLSTTHA